MLERTISSNYSKFGVGLGEKPVWSNRKEASIFQWITKDFTSKAWEATAAFPYTEKFKRKTVPVKHSSETI